MLLEPGPLPQLAPDLGALAPEAAEFSPLITDALAELPAADDDLAIVVDMLGALDIPAEFDNIDNELDTADEGLNELAGFVTSSYVDNAAAAVELAQGNLNQVSSEGPAELWQPVPDPQAGPGGGPSHAGQTGPTSLTLANLTRPGDPSFYSGDEFSLTVQIDSGGGNFDFQNVTENLTRSLNGQQQSELAIGVTDQFGRLVYRSTFDPSSVGSRVFGLDPAGWGTNPQVSVEVKPGPAPGGPAGSGAGAISVALENLTTGDGANFRPGDIWRYVITGPASQPVYLDQTKDGIDQGEIYIGNTDGTGALVVAGTISAASLGVYSETFRVGTSRFSGSISFVVVV